MVTKIMAAFAVTASFLLFAGPASAADYPPSVSPGGDTAVEGVKSGNLAATGFDGTNYLWIGAALLALGIVLLFVARRRSHS